MIIKFKFNNQFRKINKTINNFEDLKEEAISLFGEEVHYCDFLYQDEDEEFVNIYNDDDLDCCVEESEENGNNCIKIFLQLQNKETKQKRSASVKRKDIQGDFVVIEDQKHQEEVKEERQNSTEKKVQFEISGQEKPQEAERDARLQELKQRKKAMIEEKMENKKRKIEQELNAKLERVEAQKRKKLENIEKKKIQKMKQASRSASRKFKNQGEKKGRGKPQFVQDLIDIKKSEQKKPLKKLIEDIKQEFPDMKKNPLLVHKILGNASEEILEVLKKHAQKVIAENPDLVKRGEENRADLESRKNRNKSPNTSSADKDQKSRRQERKLMKDKRKELKLQQKKIKLIKEKVQILVKVFPKTPRPMLRTFVSANLNLEIGELISKFKKEGVIMDVPPLGSGSNMAFC